MNIKYEFHGYDFDFDVPIDAIDRIFQEHYPEVDDWQWWLQFEENEKQFEDEWYDYLKDMFEDLAYEEAAEQMMDPYDFYGVSRKHFY
jgi:hypothetical protein